MLPTTRNQRGTGLSRTRDLREEMDRLFDSMLGTPTRSWSSWTPAADLYETDSAYAVELELPGFRREELDVKVERGILTISGRREAESEDGGQTYHLRERSVGRFTRSFSLPTALDADQVSATFDDGILRVELPKTAESKPRQIEVN